MCEVFKDSNGVYMRGKVENGATLSRITPLKDMKIKCDNINLNVVDTYDTMRFYNYWLKIPKEDNVKKAYYNLEGEDCCKYCPYQDECHGVTGGPNGPIYPYCADHNIYAELDYEKFKEDYFREIEEENKMKVLDIYESRKVIEFQNEKNKKVEEILNNNKYINRYNELVKTFEASLEEFAEEENVKAENVLFNTGYSTSYKYEIRDSYKEYLVEDVFREYDKKIEDLKEYLTEVKSIIELIPQDGNYDAKVIEVLKNYDILDKKGKINA